MPMAPGAEEFEKTIKAKNEMPFVTKNGSTDSNTKGKEPADNTSTGQSTPPRIGSDAPPAENT
ncbi:MAG: hypothetical protein M1812_008594, partial [Candelaria pacifica]